MDKQFPSKTYIRKSETSTKTEKMKIEYARRAVIDLTEIYEFIAEENHEAALSKITNI